MFVNDPMKNAKVGPDQLVSLTSPPLLISSLFFLSIEPRALCLLSMLYH
jgi:hypothetical protein